MTWYAAKMEMIVWLFFQLIFARKLTIGLTAAIIFETQFPSTGKRGFISVWAWWTFKRHLRQYSGDYMNHHTSGMPFGFTLRGWIALSWIAGHYHTAPRRLISTLSMESQFQSVLNLRSSSWLHCGVLASPPFTLALSCKYTHPRHSKVCHSCDLRVRPGHTGSRSQLTANPASFFVLWVALCNLIRNVRPLFILLYSVFPQYTGLRKSPSQPRHRWFTISNNRITEASTVISQKKPGGLTPIILWCLQYNDGGIGRLQQAVT